jgi:hypothetical protein
VSLLIIYELMIKIVFTAKRKTQKTKLENAATFPYHGHMISWSYE